MEILSDDRILLRNVRSIKSGIIENVVKIMNENGEPFKPNPADAAEIDGDKIPDLEDPRTYWEKRNEECIKKTGFPDYVALHKIRSGRHPRLPFYRASGQHWANPCMSPYPSLFQVMTIAAAGKCDVKIMGYSPCLKRVLEDTELFSYEHDVLISTNPGRMVDEMLSATIGAPDARVYKIVMKKRFFRKPVLYIYLSTDDILDESIYLDYDGNHVYPIPDEFEVKI